MTLSWISLRVDFSDGGISTEHKTDHCWISKRQKHWHLNMTDLFTRRRDIPRWPWIKHDRLGKCSNGKLHTSTLVNDGTLRSKQSTADFASALSNVNNVKISNLLEFIVMLLFSSLCFHPKIICRKMQDYENIHRKDSFLIT